MTSQSSEERPRGILSPADREFLAGNRELGSPQARSNARARIRERVKNAYFDMMFLWQCLPAEELETIVESETVEERIALRKAFQDTIAFTVRAIDHANDDKPLRISAALIQAGAVEPFESNEDGISWDDSTQDTIPSEFVLEYPSETSDALDEDVTDDTGI